METLSRAILPFYIPMLFVLILVTYIPALALAAEPVQVLSSARAGHPLILTASRYAV